MAQFIFGHVGSSSAGSSSVSGSGAIFLQADPDFSYSVLDVTFLQSMGTVIDPTTLSAGGYPGNATDGIVNFHHTADPAGTGKAFKFQVAQRDTPGSTGGKRTELSWSPSTWPHQIGSTYWSGLRVRVSNNLKATSSTNEVVIWQLQHGLAAGGLNPNMAFVATGGGNHAELFHRIDYATTATPSLAANETGRTTYTLTDYPIDTWMTFVLQFKLHHTAGNGAFCKVWKDGTLIVNDIGPNAYNGGQESATATSNYQKIGVYHYYDDQWTAGDSITIWHKGIVAYSDTATLSEPYVRSIIEGL